MFTDDSFSTNLLAAGLFDISYGVDSVRGQADTLSALLVFCIVALGHDRQEFDAVVDSIFDPNDEDGVAAIARTHMMMDHVFSESKQASRSKNPELTMVANGIFRLIKWQFREGDCKSRRKFIDRITKA